MTDDLRVYGTALPGRATDANTADSIRGLARRAEKYGYTGLLAFYNHENIDPWVVAAVMLQATRSLVPLVALQPYAVPPITAAKTLHDLATLYRRRIDVNLITGGIRGELGQVGDDVDHDGRYDRAVEHISIVRRLTSSPEPLTHEGTYYRTRKLLAHAVLPEDLRPRVFVAGSSAANLRAALDVADATITHPEPVDAFAARFAAPRHGHRPRIGIRVGLIARPTDEEAWDVARRGYPPDRRAMAMTALKTRSESDWNRRIARLAVAADVHDEVYWTGAYRSDRALMPQLVGSYERVAAYLRRYLALGVRELLLGGVLDEEEFAHCDVVLDRVR
ncbi:LLM class flavin-dependent oxidoreductase [Catenuloplanes indicus]|uniref:Alkanesulfonate monooxygenase SsuD/methylene tetrahydromethanopterin reductase-like flavin-dependent oxidoreductase (Luciferase family) n=1 Tax=Catenuloplanes indicus TaxID=137267 RepID=A0AAE3VWE6_9ACTN|nr:LLM class flavin-dependent oxidoreductase [Catenuloplanes indicus]MDQ0364925.1 alkanesulfonate monooxygenase SsuD/methylene tetrahydromethanopterin reductase-like flavin-dependent oxidoreductase (luciferase family) [Catenuloplanes indicus]